MTILQARMHVNKKTTKKTTKKKRAAKKAWNNEARRDKVGMTLHFSQPLYAAIKKRVDGDPLKPTIAAYIRDTLVFDLISKGLWTYP